MSQTISRPEESRLDSAWDPNGWRSLPILQAPAYPDPEALDDAAAHLSTLPPLVTSWEIEKLRTALAEAAVGKRFLLQGGDCAETFAECNSHNITNKLKILLQMSLVLLDGLKRPVIRVGRLAGQYAKPRSSALETRNGVSLSSYYGDLINGSSFDAASRTPDPQRLVSAYHHSAMTLNFVRALIDGGFTDLHHPEYWDLNFLGKAGLPEELRETYRSRTESIGNAIDLMEALTGRRIAEITEGAFYASHEGLSLHYESALTRQVPRRAGFYNLGCHLPWVGERTRALGHAHIEYFRGIRNPIGIKIGPKVTPDELVCLAEALDPTMEPGRLVLIARMGEGNVERVMPGLIEAMRRTGRLPVWVCDPMHGNTVSTGSGIKTRHVSAILNELSDAIAVHQRMGSVLGGVHFELTADNVTECVGGASGVTEDDLSTRYQSLCDPRLNYEQAMELAFAIADRLEGN